MTFTKPKSILNIAHRGARAYAPENTLVAFAKAKTLGCDMFEMDVQLTKDGEVVVFHDDDLIRCTDALTRFPNRGSYHVSEFSLKEISQLDAGSWYTEQLTLPKHNRQLFLQTMTEAEMTQFISPMERSRYASGTIRIPTLAESLRLAKDLALMVNIELKSKLHHDDILVKHVIEDVQALKLESQILISSFNHELVKQVRQQTLAIATAILADCPIRAPVSYLHKLKVDSYNLGCYKDYKTNGFDGVSGQRYLNHIATVRKAGFDVNVWTCNDQEEMGYLLGVGVTGIISDYPNRVQECLAAYS